MRSYREFVEILDKVFKRDDVRGQWGPELNGEVAWHLGFAFVSILRADGKSSVEPGIVVGRDMREGSPEMAFQLIRGIRAAGGTVDNVGMCGSEMIYYVTGEDAEQYAGGAMVTASHNPPEYAGVKFVKSGSVPLSSDELRDLKKETARSYALHLQDALCGPERSDKTDRFVEKLLSVSGPWNVPDNAKLKVVVEAGNGMGGTTFRPVAERLKDLHPGIEFVFCDETPDGTFPICTPNPLLDDYINLLSYRVRREGADLGICFDGDADRAGFVDNRGQLVDASLVSMILLEKLREKTQNRPYVMGNLNSSMRFTDYVKEPMKFVMTPVGHAKIKGLMRTEPYFSIESGECNVLFASEHSGHYFYPDFYYADSGMTTALIIIRFALEAQTEGATLSEKLLSMGLECHTSGEINTKLKDDNEAIAKIEAVAAAYRELPRLGIIPEKDGTHRVRDFDTDTPYNPAELAALDLRIDSAENESPRWWFSVRKSGNEPELRLNVESTDKSKMEEVRDKLLGMIRAK